MVGRLEGDAGGQATEAIERWCAGPIAGRGLQSVRFHAGLLSQTRYEPSPSLQGHCTMTPASRETGRQRRALPAPHQRRRRGGRPGSVKAVARPPVRGAASMQLTCRPPIAHGPCTATCHPQKVGRERRPSMRKLALPSCGSHSAVRHGMRDGSDERARLTCHRPKATADRCAGGTCPQ